MRAVAKLHEVEVAENVTVFDDTHGDQAAAPQQIKAATVHRKPAPGISDFGKMSAGEKDAFSRESKSGSPAELIVLFTSIPRVPVLPVLSINGEMDHWMRPLSFLAP
ncbi:MAG TPA: hypothetical protein VKB89_07855 [Xanthobacteraceae bacterium]|nr:hypothetical protein [Xanthobacteraceae bacterium]